MNRTAALAKAWVITSLIVGLLKGFAALLGYGDTPILNQGVSLILLSACLIVATAIVLRLQAIAEEIQALFTPNEAPVTDPQDMERQAIQELVAIAQAMQGKGGVEVKSRRYRLNIYSQCFVGAEAVTWLSNRQNCSREQAVQLGQQLCDKGLIYHVTRDHPFQDRQLFYRFDLARIAAAAMLNSSTEESASRPMDLEAIAQAMKAPNGVDIQDRRYRLNVYPQCFVGSAAVDWLAQSQGCSREEAVELGQLMLDRKLIHHVTDDHGFEDAYLFYRFADQTPLDAEVATPQLSAAQIATLDLDILVQAMRQPNGLVIKDRRYRLNVYAQCFLGCEAVEWLMQTQGYSRDEAIAVGQLLIDQHRIHHVTDDHPFRDEYLFYRFYQDEPSQEKSKS